MRSRTTCTLHKTQWILVISMTGQDGAIFKWTVLKSYWESCSATGTAGKLCVRSFTWLGVYVLVPRLHLQFLDNGYEISKYLKYLNKNRYPKKLRYPSPELGWCPYLVGRVSPTCSRFVGLDGVARHIHRLPGPSDPQNSRFCSDIYCCGEPYISKFAISHLFPLYDPQDNTELLGTFDQKRIGCITKNLRNNAY